MVLINEQTPPNPKEKPNRLTKKPIKSIRAIMMSQELLRQKLPFIIACTDSKVLLQIPVGRSCYFLSVEVFKSSLLTLTAQSSVRSHLAG